MKMLTWFVSKTSSISRYVSSPIQPCDTGYHFNQCFYLQRINSLHLLSSLFSFFLPFPLSFCFLRPFLPLFHFYLLLWGTPIMGGPGAMPPPLMGAPYGFHSLYHFKPPFSCQVTKPAKHTPIHKVCDRGDPNFEQSFFTSELNLTSCTYAFIGSHRLT